MSEGASRHEKSCGVCGSFIPLAKSGDAVVVCPRCGTESEVTAPPATPICPSCGRSLTDEGAVLTCFRCQMSYPPSYFVNGEPQGEPSWAERQREADRA